MGVTFHTYNNENLKTDISKILELAKILLAGQGVKCIIIQVSRHLSEKEMF